ncbi:MULTISPECIES: DUF262 domain-containing protein [Nocardia]|uniref:DUF262 domain-containing protein n=1 Tax=Nocardia TaxID=1817 RepID=UPI0007A43979|nr:MULTISPECIES: DUF262 domain-containing protein [Nocardia]MBF6276376.1 DUF262 domain-containing protein [Nocardia nova]OBF82923.1 hypothetical protein A9X06_18325 [Mycobacterium sp. 852002-51759_SCH5129042]
MKADALSPRALFDGRVHYEIPVFQRPYVWSEEDQWEPLWQDVVRVAEQVVAAGSDEDALAAVSAHFLGAIVFKARPAITGDVTRYGVIDGQQRTTTLLLLLDAAKKVFIGRGYEDQAEALDELTVNPARRFQDKAEHLKLRPSRVDHAAFTAAMTAKAADKFQEHRIVEAHNFFRRQIEDWIDDGGSAGASNPSLQRAKALTDVLQFRLMVVAINLSGHDDDQLIFETLNDRGTPLLKADLIKNWVFQRGEKLHADIDSWPDRFWLEFDDDWWREEIAQGRHNRSRIDIFLQYWLTMRTRREVLINDTFRIFTEYADPHTKTVAEAERFLTALASDASTFRSFATRPTTDPVGRFYDRVIQEFELAATTPLLMWLVSDNHDIPEDQVALALSCLESWVVRRTLLRLPSSDINRLMVSALAKLDGEAPKSVGASLQRFLSEQQAESRRWPTDEEIKTDLPGLRLYGRVKQNRLRVVLLAVEALLRTERNETVTVHGDLQVEHVMPRKWKQHWDEQPPLNEAAARDRDRLVDSLGNLTLTTQSLNGGLSNRPWTDDEAKLTAPTGKHAQRGKYSLLNQYSLLALTKELLNGHEKAWTEDDIEARSEVLADKICQAWPGPVQHVSAGNQAGT